MEEDAEDELEQADEREELEEDEDEEEEADVAVADRSLNLEAFDCPLREWIAEDRTRR